MMFRLSVLHCCIAPLVVAMLSVVCQAGSLKAQTKQYPAPMDYAQPPSPGNLLGATIANSLTAATQGAPLGNVIGGALGSIIPGAIPGYPAGVYPQQPVYSTPLPAPIPVASSSPKKDAADQLDLQLAQREEIMKKNPFFQISHNSMKIRELATQNPALLEQVGVYVVKIKPEEAFTPEEQRKHDIAQGASDVGEGKETPCSACKEKEDEEARKELQDLKSSDKQKFLLKTMDPTQRALYLDKQKAALKKSIRVYKNILENAKHEMRKVAEDREQ